jgi:V/A-type H+/Na+-transporting ATPase subunit D
MAKIRLTKNELKKQKDALKRFIRYLPTLQLKKQQLQSEIRNVETRQSELRARKEGLDSDIRSWVAVFGEREAFLLDALRPVLVVKAIKKAKGNIAGVEIPVFMGADFTVSEYDLHARPLWIDKAADRLKEVLLLDLEILVLDEQARLLRQELRITTQRVNLFEKIKIPEARETIRKIGIYLGDQQTAAVVRGKMAKKNLEKAVS